MPGFDELDGKFNKLPGGCRALIALVLFVVISVLRGLGIV